MTINKAQALTDMHKLADNTSIYYGSRIYRKTLSEAYTDLAIWIETEGFITVLAAYQAWLDNDQRMEP